ncbi:hypothetical protein AAH994_06090 [Weeksellaceae bacterium A-14]
MKKIIFLPLLITSFAFSQSQDFTRKEAFNAFVKSENRKKLKYSKSDFKIIYDQAKCIKNHYNIDLKEMPIFKSNTDVFVSKQPRFRMSLFGLGDTVFPGHDENGNKTVTCNAFITSQGL